MIPSLRTFWLRMKKDKVPKFKERVPTKRFRLIQRGVILLCLVGVAYSVFWIQTTDWSLWEDKDDVASLLETFDADLVLEHKEGEVLETRDLIYLAGKMERDINAPLPVQMHWVEQRSEIANKLLVKPDDELAQKEGTLYRMEALQLLSNLNRKYRLGNKAIDIQLQELCAANLNHQDPDVAKIAAVSIMMTSIHQFSTVPTQANRKEALDYCRQVASQLVDDDEIAAAIYKYARLMKKSDSMVDDSVHFFNVVIDEFLDSKNAKARGIAELSFNEILFGDESADPKFAKLLIVGIKDRMRQNRLTADGELTNRIRFALRPKLLYPEAIEQISSLLEVFIAMNKIPDARELIADTQAFFLGLDESDAQLTSVANRFLNDLKVRVGKYNKQFDLSGLTTVASQQHTFKNRMTLVTYWSASDSRSTKLLNSLTNLSYSQLLQCIIVLTDPGEEAILVAEKLSKEIPGFHFAIADSNTRSGKRFVDEFPVPSLPYMVLLDDTLRVVAINPDVRDLGQKINTLIN